jgi:1,4-alpha-glucan branching enzyme
LLAPLPTLGSHDELHDFIEMAHEQELAVLWDLPLSVLLEAHDLGNGAGFDWAHQGGALASVVAAGISFWHTEMHVDGFRLRELDELLRPDTRAAGKRRAVAGADANPFAREWLGMLLQQLRERYPSLLLIVDTALPLPELTLSARKGGMGADFRSTEAQWPWLNPVPASHCGHGLAQLLRRWQDGNPHQQLALLASTAGTDSALLQLMLLMFWTLPARKLLRSEWQLQPDPTWQPERGHDYQLVFEPVMAEAGMQLLQQLNALYLHYPGLYELDASHEGINVLQCSETVCAFERCSRLGHEALLVVINADDQAAAGVQLRLQCDRRYRLVCSVGQHTFPASLQTRGARSASGCTAAIDIGGVSGALYALEN